MEEASSCMNEGKRSVTEQERKKKGMAECAAFLKNQGLRHSVKRFYRDGLYKICKTIPSIIIFTNVQPWPSLFYARLFDGTKPTGYFAVAESLEDVRKTIPQDWLLRFPRKDSDAPAIVETWM